MTDGYDLPTGSSLRWRSDVDALSFRPEGHDGVCMVHRHAFRTLLKRMPTPGDCAAFFQDQEAAFHLAAHGKIAHARLASGTNLHLTSRDLARAMAKLAVASPEQSR
ncbi:hypothetical protein E0H22_12945 [Rhodopseudomonas boonkerdii]|uniref:hypothetical protein n=1 Tax=Rhodopseudomonas boonkerdii TaxID=475937 RepID=UPI001E4B16A2|nr:hypothetical protein [Rhodopseudomonas boonkerdii]UGV26517.1 hypothetical protein E0H22_12945 [Rhodopseudomonas boonkerdii]